MASILRSLVQKDPEGPRRNQKDPVRTQKDPVRFSKQRQAAFVASSFFVSVCVGPCTLPVNIEMYFIKKNNQWGEKILVSKGKP